MKSNSLQIACSYFSPFPINDRGSQIHTSSFFHLHQILGSKAIVSFFGRCAFCVDFDRQHDSHRHGGHISRIQDAVPSTTPSNRWLFSDAARGVPGPSISFFDEHIVAHSAEGARFEKSFSFDDIVVFDRGFRGYGSYIALPKGFPELILLSPIHSVIERKSRPRKREESTPALRLLIEDGD